MNAVCSSLRIKPITMLASLPISDVVDMLARLKAAETVWDLLVANGMEVGGYEQIKRTMQAGQQFLQQEAEQRFNAMREQ